VSVRPFTNERHDGVRELVERMFAKDDDRHERVRRALDRKTTLNEGLLAGARAGIHDAVEEAKRKAMARVEPGGAARALADAGLLPLAVPAAYEGTFEAVSPLALCVAREGLAGRRADFDAALAVQTLAALPVARAGTFEQRERWLQGFATGRERGAFALTEPRSGSDVAALSTTATREGDGYRLEGEKVLISRAPSATMLVVFARTGEAGTRAISAFVVLPDAPGVEIGVVPNLGEHELGSVRFEGVWVPESARIGAEGDGLSLALGALELMRPTVGAAACGMAARALEETRALARERVRDGAPLAEHESVRMKLAEMATELEAARLLVYRAAWLRETTAAETRLDAPAAMAKLFATEAAGRIVDAAVQIHGGLGVVSGAVVERLYREVRALRIYEGTSEIQKLVIARSLL
jgi:acyl-CoA dehydrogenase